MLLGVVGRIVFYRSFGNFIAVTKIFKIES